MKNKDLIINELASDAEYMQRMICRDCPHREVCKEATIRDCPITAINERLARGYQ
jgi:hypothetical protein